MIATWPELIRFAKQVALVRRQRSEPQELVSVPGGVKIIEDRVGFLGLRTRHREVSIPPVVLLRGWPLLHLGCVYEHVAWGGDTPPLVEEKLGAIWIDGDGGLHVVETQSGSPPSVRALDEFDAERLSGVREWTYSHSDRHGQRTHEYSMATFAPVDGDPFHSIRGALAKFC
ncbi:hypothetical protein ACWZJV_05405 [Nocardioides sp. WG-D5]